MAIPDPVALMVAYLDSAMTPDVAVDVGDPRPTELIQVRRIGGPANPPVRDRPNLDIISWAGTATAAMTNLLVARTLIWALAGTTTLGVTTYLVDEPVGPRQRNDPQTGDPMASFTVALDIRADDLIQQFS